MTDRQHDHDTEPDALDDDELDVIAAEIAAHMKAAGDMTLSPPQFEHALDRAVARVVAAVKPLVNKYYEELRN